MQDMYCVPNHVELSMPMMISSSEVYIYFQLILSINPCATEEEFDSFIRSFDATTAFFYM